MELPLSTAVLDFHSPDDRYKELGGQFATLLSANLSASEAVFLVERQALEEILGEQELTLSGNVAASSAARIGQLTGAKLLIVGSVFSSDGKSATVVAKVIGTETGRMYAETANFPIGEVFDEPAKWLAGKVDAAVAKHRATLVTSTETREELMARLGEAVKGKELPSVSVNIPETHLSDEIPDPAVETEIKLMLQELGFKIVDPVKSGDKADIAITGEAFSEMGSRRGNLVSCRARVELNMTPKDPGVEAWVDRTTESGIDLGEHVAAKNALQEAGAILAERLVLSLVQ